MELKSVKPSPEPETYEMPALVPIGGVAELTGGQDSSVVYSDERLKDEVRPVGSALERLRRVETYEAPEATALGRVEELTGSAGPSTMDESDERLKQDLEPIDSAVERLRELEIYEAPRATTIGRVEELTGLDDQSVTPSDERLKDDVEPVRSALERLAEIETYEAPQATSIGRVDELTTIGGPSTVDGTTTTSGGRPKEQIEPVGSALERLRGLETYEAPEATSIGGVHELTTDNPSTIDSGASDERLKEDLEPVGSALERLRGIETYEAPGATAIGGVEELTAGFDSSTTDASDSDERLKERIEPVESALARLRSIGTR
jgi:hypothetical protein